MCPPTWDGWQCWEGGAKAGEVEERHCPAYIYFFTHGAHNGVGCQSKSALNSPVMYPLSSDTARKTCREDGWFTHNGTLEEWTDFSGCDKTDDIVQMEYIR